MKKHIGLFLIIAAGACERAGDSPTGGAPAAKGPEATMTTNSISSAFGAALALPRLAAEGAQSSRMMLVEAVYFATAQSGAGQFGQITSTGTIRISDQGATYAPAPADKLVAQVGAQVHEFKLKNAQGNSSAATALDWVGSPHLLEYIHTIPDQAEANINIQFDGNNFSARMSGWAMLAKQRYEIDLTAQGATSGNSDYSGAERKTQYRMTGTIRGAGADVTVLEEHTMSFASAVGLNLLPSQRGNATQVKSSSSSSVKIGGDIYKFNNVQAESGSKEKGNQSSGGLISAAGLVTKKRCAVRRGDVTKRRGGNCCERGRRGDSVDTRRKLKHGGAATRRLVGGRRVSLEICAAGARIVCNNSMARCRELYVVPSALRADAAPQRGALQCNRWI